MSRLAKTSMGSSSRPLPVLVPAAPEISSTYLAPADPFPALLAEVELMELLVLHSRVTRQLDREYLDPDGPHPVSVDRAQELAAELDARQEFLAPARPASPAAPEAGTSPAPRGAGRNVAARASIPVTEERAATARGEASAVSTLDHDQKHGQGPSRTEDHTMGDPPAKGAEAPVYDSDRLRPGHRIQVWHRGQLQCVGTVEETAPSLGVVWIREDVDGHRRMVHTHDADLRYHRPGTAR